MRSGSHRLWNSCGGRSLLPVSKVEHESTEYPCLPNGGDLGMAALINSIVIPQPLQGYLFARDVILCNMPVASNLQGTGNKELEPPGQPKGSKNLLLNKPKLGPTLP